MPHLVSPTHNGTRHYYFAPVPREDLLQVFKQSRWRSWACSEK